MPLPFWDDFSFAGQASDTLWADKQSVRIMDGMAIRPPSIGAAVFDGLNGFGTAYETDLTANGFTDTLVSRPIRLGDVALANRDSVYLSFVYQWKGNGEAPDPADYLQVDFRNAANVWIPISLLRVTTTPNAEVFIDYLQKIEEEDFFHNNFQFRISRYGRKSGAFDTWLVDYVYLNEHRFGNDFSFPDRSISSPLTSLFGDYYAVPKDHFLLGPTISNPAYILSTQKNEPTPLSESSVVEADNYLNGSFTTHLDSLDKKVGMSLPAFGKLEAEIQTLPDTGNPLIFDPLADSTLLRITLVLNSSDNIYDRYPPGHPLEDLDEDNADYDSATYYPIDFRLNDTIQSIYTLSNYYAYDDGVAEYSVGLAQAGNRGAFGFTQLANEADTLTGVYIYFPTLTGTLSTIVTLQVYSDDGGQPGSLLGEENVSVQRPGIDQFHRIPLKNSVLVPKKFYIGWEQPANGIIAIGLDRSSDHTGKLFSNSNGLWLPPSNVRGTPMIRPIFGSGKIVTSAPEPETSLALFPNPADNHFTINKPAEVLNITTMNGESVDFTQQREATSTNIHLQQNVRGLVIIQIRFNNQVTAHKLILH